MHTSSSYKRYSRRRIAALSFLSNISLDGSHQDLKTSSTSTSISCDEKQSIKKQDHGVKCSPLNADDLQTVRRDVVTPTSTSANRNTQGGSMTLESEDIDVLCNTRGAACELNRTNSKRKKDEQGKTRSGIYIFRERSATVGSYETVSPKSQCSRLRTLNHLDKTNLQTSFENVEPQSTTSHLLPITSHSHRRHSSNTSESSHSPTGSGLREKEVRFLTSIKDFSNQMPDQRMVLVTAQCSPIMVFSTLPYSRCNKITRGDFRGDSARRRQASGNRPASSIGDYPDLYSLLGLPKPAEGQVVSYCQMLVPSSHFCRESSTFRRVHSTADGYESEMSLNNSRAVNPLTRCISHDPSMLRSSHGRPASPVVSIDSPKLDVIEEGSTISSSMNYHPSLLDNPELWIAGKHSTLMTFPSYMMSVIDYVKPSDLKKELNNKFKEKFPHIQLTLSKLRSLKREMRKIAVQESGADLLTVAQSYVYFEKLILRGMVHKGNRKLCAGAALLLSAKMNDVKGETLKTLIEEMQNAFRVSRRDLFATEFAVLVALEFSLHVPTWEIFPHYQRLLYDS